MASVPAPARAGVTGRDEQPRRARLLEAWVYEGRGYSDVEIESRSHTDYFHLVRVNFGHAEHVYDERHSAFPCPASEYGRACRHVAEARQLVELWRELADARASWDLWVIEEASSERNYELSLAQTRVSWCEYEAERLGYRFAASGKA